MPTTSSRRTVPGLAAMARAGEKIAMLTCYDASFAALLDRAGVDAVLIGDSLGMVIGGYKMQAKTEESAKELRDDAHRLVAAGIELLVLEMVPASVAASITGELAIPTIGIGAGPGCSGQVLVLYDMLGIYPGKQARFVRNFMSAGASVEDAVRAYVKAVKDGSFPGPEHYV